MKARVLILLVVCAVVTLSFTFATSHKAEKKTTAATTTEASVGGMTSEDPIK